jgi:SM-20-related protein
LQPTFDVLIDSFIADEVGLAQDFLPPALAALLQQNLRTLYANQQLQSAGMGNNAVLTHDKTWRNDKIHWLDRSHSNPHEQSFFILMDSFVAHLNRTCYTGITDYEFHYALYEKGSFYKRHLDQFRDNKSRAYSMILYLNADWQAADGGELCIYHHTHTQIIAPMNGQCVFFKSSELEHEVLLTHQPRLSITGWLKVAQ